MNANAQKGGLEELVPLAEVVPLVGQILGAAARYVLRKEEIAEISSCLTRALDTTDASKGMPGFRDRWRHPRERRAWHAAQRQAAEEILACGGIILADEPVSQPAEPTPRRSLDGAEFDLSGGNREMLQTVLRLAREELTSALAEESYTPWTVRTSATLTLNAKARWEARYKAVERPNDDPELQRLAGMIANSKNARPKQVDDDAFAAFGMRVGRRFAANLEASESLRSLVTRLDLEDRQKAESAMVKAAQGLRVALLMIVIVLVIATAALVEMAIRQTI